MGKSDFSDKFKCDAMLQLTERGEPVVEFHNDLKSSTHLLYV